MSTPIPPYGVAIHNAIASGDLKHMRAVAADAEKFVQQHGDISAALEMLRAEIAKHGRTS